LDLRTALSKVSDHSLLYQYLSQADALKTGEILKTDARTNLLNLMGWPQPIYYHHDLVLRADGEKLAKRNLDTSLEHLRSHGQSLEEIKQLSAYTL